MWTSTRTKSFIILLISASLFAWANGSALLPVKKKAKTVVSDSLARKGLSDKDSLRTEGMQKDDASIDTLSMDSLQLAVYHHNKAIDDSIRADSVNRAKKKGIDAPVTYTADDSLVYDAMTKDAKLFGNAEVKYENMDLKSDKIRMNLDSSLVHATGTPDSAEKGGIKGRPVFAMGSDTYDTDTISFNFKTKRVSCRMLIPNRKTASCEAKYRSVRSRETFIWLTAVIPRATRSILISTSLFPVPRCVRERT